MTQPELKQSLERLQNEIKDLKSISATEKQELENIILSVRHAMDLDEEHTGADLQESLQAAVMRLEASHPRLTAVLNDIMVTLSNLGI